MPGADRAGRRSKPYLIDRCLRSVSPSRPGGLVYNGCSRVPRVRGCGSPRRTKHPPQRNPAGAAHAARNTSSCACGAGGGTCCTPSANDHPQKRTR
eukprot:4895735-Prymnesium_polylepis.2